MQISMDTRSSSSYTRWRNRWGLVWKVERSKWFGLPTPVQMAPSAVQSVDEV